MAADPQHLRKKSKIYSLFTLKDDNESRPLWVLQNGTIILETSSEIYKQASDFCIAIAEPESRLQHFHEYKLTPASLYGAASAGLKTKDIMKYLKMLCKTNLHPEVIKTIETCTENVKKLNLYLKDGNMIMESEDPKDMKYILGFLRGAVEENLSEKSVKIQHNLVEKARQVCREKNYPLTEIYDYKNDSTCPDLGIKLKPNAKLRPYQKRSVDQIFVGGKARSGIIVLPCGAGKSLTGVYCTVRLGKPCLCFANTGVSVEQWVYQFKTWSTIGEKRIQGLTSDTKAEDFDGKADIVVTTYSMYGYSGKRSQDSEAIMKKLTAREWGLVLMDEVHVVPATNFREAVARTKAHCKVGLTATLLREDDAIQDLEFIIGPKVYEANWQELVQAGYLADVKCYEVQCPMSKEYLREYLNLNLTSGDEKRNIQTTLYSANPSKLMACEYLINLHEHRGDKIIVFADNLFVLNQTAKRLRRAIIRGQTTHEERRAVLEAFKASRGGFTVFLSKVGDTSIDLPEATVVIQISSQGGSRRQEAQRLGRVLRPKPGKAHDGGGEAFFYSLVSQDTSEVMYATKRQQFLVNQGYSFSILTDVPTKDECKDLYFNREDVQAELLMMALKEEKAEEEIPKPQPKAKGGHRNVLFKQRNKNRK